ncbi:pentatricopeptide repeat-containing protein At4g32430, mitochondrial [Andrographis paniculata]|uniref:pentatricopeptide repeat-containing protein At4g32430, mitochondrial n=1 Tax=Andrographis paniculata TaxID=175694 RepID=UPI0021E7E44C|nr:pentatricopeptide repeat-containing protein At4g32430, mitochondrial [Andrographis paniculata]
MLTRRLRRELLLQRSKHSRNFGSFHNGHHMFDEIPDPPLVSVHRTMLNLIRQHRQGEALGFFKKHLRAGLSGIDEVAVVIASKASIGHPKIGSQIHGFALVSGSMHYVSVCNSLMNMYCKSRDLMSGLRLFESLKDPDTISYNTVLSGFEESKSALYFASGMHLKGKKFDAVTCTCVLAHCADAQEIGLGRQFHCLVFKFGLEAEVFIGNALVTLYSKGGKIADSGRVFGEMIFKDSVSWNALLSGYAQDGFYGCEAVMRFVEMVKCGVKLDHVAFTSIISVCGQDRDLKFGKQAHALSIKCGYGAHVSVCNVLMSMYSKCDMVGDSKLVFKNMADRNVVSWTTMLSIDEENAMNLFKEMVRQSVYPNDVTFVGLIHGLTNHDKMCEGLLVHGFCVKSNILSETNVANSFITMYGKFSLAEDSLKIFMEIGDKEIISWNALISAYSLNGMYQEALHVFWSASQDLVPDAYTFGSVLHAIAMSESISLTQGRRCHGNLRKLGLDTDPVVSGALLDMYAKRGCIRESEKVFDELDEKNLVSWTAIISAHSKHGDYESVMKYFEKMLTEGVRPDAVTFLSVLTSCGHNGMVDAGIEVFNLMVREHSVEPFPEHYSCIVDMLGRAGRLDEAEEILRRIDIPGRPGISVLQSLLGACRIHGNVDMAIRVSDALLAMEPTESGSYVLMANLFAEKGKWENAAKMRRLMRDRKVAKEIGFSWADIGDVFLHGFSSGDKTHRRWEEIYGMAELLLLGSEMKKQEDDDDDNECL